MADSPGSPLSEHGSDEFEDDVKLENSDLEDDIELPSMPPAKKQRTGHTSFRATPQPVDEMDDDISSDSSGEPPSSPTGLGQVTEDEADQQVSVCRWRGCTAGDLENMDELVKHIHEVHIGTRQKKYACEWEGCTRMDATHASGYALRAHMRSHTREKPFYCALPECDKAFTRSDALAKHMRTVHETEALRPSDPVRASQTQTGKPQRLKLLLKAPVPETSESNALLSPAETIENFPSTTYPAELEFTEEESAMSPDQLFSLLRRQVHWAEEEGRRLKEDCKQLEKKRKEEWRKKELVLANVIEAELAFELRENKGKPDVIRKAMHIKEGLLPETMLPMPGDPPPWWRINVDEMSVASVETIAEVANGIKDEEGLGAGNGLAS